MRWRALILILALAVVPAFGAVVYTDFTSFQNAVAAGYYTETFNDLAADDLGTNTMSFPAIPIGYSFVATVLGTDTGNLWGIDVEGSRALGTQVQGVTVSLDFSGSPNPVSAVGGYFLPTDDIGNIVDGEVVFHLSDGTDTTTVVSAGVNSFTGFTTDFGTYITSLTFTAAPIPPDLILKYPVLDNLSLGQTAAPEPGSLLLLGGALVGLLVLRRKR
jgi:hypothetical protein